MASSRCLLLAMVAVACLSAAHAFYLPGVPPRNYKTNEKVDMQVNKVESVKTQLTYRFYDLPFCAPEEVEDLTESLGQVLSGDRMENSLYEFFAKYNEYCKVLCNKVLTKEEADKFTDYIRDEYTVDWVLDNLPAAVRMYDQEQPDEIFYKREFNIGEMDLDGQTAYLFNHIRFVIKYNSQESEEGIRIVGFEVEPFSVQHEHEGDFGEGVQLATCNDARWVDRDMAPQRVGEGVEVIFTYDVRWEEENEVAWAERWNVYTKSVTPDDEIHWLSIVNSVLIVLFLTGMIAMIMARALYRDIARYNEEQTLEEQAEETGWKLVHADVFRAPSGCLGRMALSVAVGSGIQILMMSIAVMALAAFGFLSPANRGGMATALLLLYVFMGSFAGYYSARLYKMYGGTQWKRNTLATAFFFPGVVCLETFLLNFFVWGKGSSMAIPFGTMVAVLVLWMLVSCPLVFIGSFFGFKKAQITLPVQTNVIPRNIPPQQWYLTGLPSALVGGVLPFGAMFIELFFVMSSIWLHQTYVLFGFAALVLLILIITSAEIAIVMCYFQLCAEDYNWAWRAFFTPGAMSLYLLAYSVIYFVTKLDITNFVSVLLYFGTMGMISFTFLLLTGSVGYLATLLFVRKIYGAIKVD